MDWGGTLCSNVTLLHQRSVLYTFDLPHLNLSVAQQKNFPSSCIYCMYQRICTTLLHPPWYLLQPLHQGLPLLKQAPKLPKSYLASLVFLASQNWYLNLFIYQLCQWSWTSAAPFLSFHSSYFLSGRVSSLPSFTSLPSITPSCKFILCCHPPPLYDKHWQF